MHFDIKYQVAPKRQQKCRNTTAGITLNANFMNLRHHAYCLAYGLAKVKSPYTTFRTEICQTGYSKTW